MGRVSQRELELEREKKKWLGILCSDRYRLAQRELENFR